MAAIRSALRNTRTPRARHATSLIESLESRLLLTIYSPTSVPMLTPTEGTVQSNVVIATFTSTESLVSLTGQVTWGPNVATISSSSLSIVHVGSVFIPGVGNSPQYEAVATFTSGAATDGNQPQFLVTISDSADGTSAAIIGSIQILQAPLLPVSTSAPTGVSQGKLFTTGGLMTFSDASPTAAVSDYLALIDWGDGAPQSVGKITALGGGVFSVSGAHTYTVPGAEDITIITEDLKGSKITATTSTTVKQTTPILASGIDVSGVEGHLISGSVATFTTADLGALANSFRATITWGDGKTSTGVIVRDGAGQFHVTASHAYARANANGYLASVTITDTARHTATDGFTAVITDAPLTAGTPLAFSVKANTNVTHLLGTFTDGNGLNTDKTLYVNSTSLITWGDGTTTLLTAANLARAGSDLAGGGIWKVTGTHKYTTPGTKNVTILVMDDDGLSTVIDVTITVTL